MNDISVKKPSYGDGEANPNSTISFQHTPKYKDWCDMAEAIWITACQGGATRWCEYIHTQGDHHIMDGEDIGKNFYVTLHDAESDDRWKGRSMDIIMDGIALLDIDLKAQVVMDFYGILDADFADRVIQLGLFGEEIFA